MRRAALVLVAIALTGCETTAEKSAKLEKQALRAAAGVATAKGLSIASPSKTIEVAGSALLRSSEGAVATVTLRNLSNRAVADVPLAIAVHDARGVTVYSNTTPGLVHSLVAAALIEAHGELTWIDDQVTGAPNAASVTARVGEGAAVPAAIPKLSVAGSHVFEEPGSGLGAKGTVVNHSAVAQSELVVYATARRGSRIVAAGRAVLAQVPAGASVPFQLFFIGDPKGAQLQVSAPPTTLR